MDNAVDLTQKIIATHDIEVLITMFYWFLGILITAIAALFTLISKLIVYMQASAKEREDFLHQSIVKTLDQNKMNMELMVQQVENIARSTVEMAKSIEFCSSRPRVLRDKQR